MNKVLIFSLASTVFLVSTGQTKAATFQIDDFTTNSSTLSTGGLVNDSASSPGILGGTRALELNHTNGGGNLTAETKQCTAVVPTLQCMTFSGDSGVEGSLSLTYGDDTIAGLDVTAGGFNDAFRVAVQFSDFATDFDIIATDTSGNIATFMGLTPAGVFFNTTGTSRFDIPFANFTGDTVDFSSLDTLEFSFVDIVPATDLEFSLVATENLNFANDPIPEPPSTTPEPTSLISLIGLLGLTALLKCHKKQALS